MSYRYKPQWQQEQFSGVPSLPGATQPSVYPPSPISPGSSGKRGRGRKIALALAGVFALLTVVGLAVTIPKVSKLSKTLAETPESSNSTISYQVPQGQDETFLFVTNPYPSDDKFSSANRQTPPANCSVQGPDGPVAVRAKSATQSFSWGNTEWVTRRSFASEPGKTYQISCQGDAVTPGGSIFGGALVWFGVPAFSIFGTMASLITAGALFVRRQR